MGHRISHFQPTVRTDQELSWKFVCDYRTLWIVFGYRLKIFTMCWHMYIMIKEYRNIVLLSLAIKAHSSFTRPWISPAVHFGVSILIHWHNFCLSSKFSMLLFFMQPIFRLIKIWLDMSVRTAWRHEFEISDHRFLGINQINNR